MIFKQKSYLDLFWGNVKFHLPFLCNTSQQILSKLDTLVFDCCTCIHSSMFVTTLHYVDCFHHLY